MTTTLLIDENIEFLKFEYRRLYPKVKSSHLTEAIAAALGFGTNATLKAHMAESVGIVDAATFSEGKLNQRLLDFGYSGSGEQSDFQIVLSGMPYRPYYEFQDDSAFRRHSKRDIPYISFREKKQKYCKLDYDHHIPSRHRERMKNYDQKSREGVRKLLNVYQQLARQLGMPSSIFNGTIVQGWISKVPISVSKQFADAFTLEYYRMLNGVYADKMNQH